MLASSQKTRWLPQLFLTPALSHAMGLKFTSLLEEFAKENFFLQYMSHTMCVAATESKLILSTCGR